MNKLFSIVLGLLLLSSCTIHQHYHFNEDMSGNYNVEIDVAEMMALMGGEEGGIEAMMSEINVDSLEDEMNKVDGITGAKIAEENGKIVIKYDFRDIEALNASLSGQDIGAYLGGTASQEVEENHIYFVKKGKKLYFSAPPMDKELLEDESAAMSMDMMKFNVKISCDRGIKKVKSEDFTLVGNDAVKLETKMTDLIKGDVTLSAQIKLR